MEKKKKFEKPELKVVELKQTGMICGSPCPYDCDPVDDCPRDGGCDRDDG